MTSNRLRRRLAALRKRACRSLDGRPVLPGCYDRALLFGGGVLLSLAVVGATSVGIAHRFERSVDSWRSAFLAQREFVNSSVERSQVRLRHMVDTYESLRHVHERDPVPVEHYRRMLERARGVVTTQQDLGAAPFTILSTLSQPADSERLAMSLQLVREISPGSLLRVRDAAGDVGGFVYTEDRRFLAVWPPLSDTAIADIRNDGIERTIARYVEHTDAELRRHSDDSLPRDRVFWVALYDSETYGTLVKHYAAPIYNGRERTAVLAVTLPATEIPRLFQPAGHDPDFFLVSRDRKHLIGLDATNPRRTRWLTALHAFPPVFDVPDDRVHLVRRGTDFFLMRRVAGPDWIAVSAFDGYLIATNLKGPISSALLLGAIVLMAQWTFIIAIDRLVLGPLRTRARRVFESEAFGRTVLATAPVGLSVFDPVTRRVVMQNDIARALVSASPDAGRFYRRLLDYRTPRRRGLRAGDRRSPALASTDALRTVETSVVTADGRRRELSVALTRVRYREQEVMLCSLTDISRQKETVRLLRRARQTADEASRAKSMLVATISHEIRTPLYGALGNLELLAMEPLDSSQAARVASVRRSFDTLLALVDDLLDFSKAEAHELTLYDERFRLDDVVERCAQTLAPTITAKGLRFSCLIEPAVAGYWRGDGRRVMQILTNLLGNACKFTEQGMITMRAGVTRASGVGEFVVLSVADSGIGISASRHARIFEPFMQADGSIGRRFGGTGLGLSLCRRLAELMGGRIDVKSAEGRGAAFSVHLPLARDVPDVAVDEPPAEFAFDQIVLACEQGAWQAALLAHLRSTLGAAVRVDQAAFDVAAMPGCARSLVVFGSHADIVPGAWQSATAAYVDVLVLSERGPFHPQRRGDGLHVTSLSAAKLALALAACGRRGAVPAPGEQPLPPRPACREHCEARILVVDDDPVSRTLMAHQMQALGYRHIDVASDGRDALANCLERPYDLVVADLCMPIMDGRELYATLRGKGMTMPVIAHTAAPDDLDNANRLGFSRLLHKPLTLECLRAALEGVLASVPLPPPVPAATGPSFVQTLRPVFAQTWSDDERALVEAVRCADAALFLQTLHRLKGALLTLGERAAGSICDVLAECVREQGIACVVERLDQFRALVARIAVPDAGQADEVRVDEFP